MTNAQRDLLIEEIITDVSNARQDACDDGLDGDSVADEMMGALERALMLRLPL